MCVAHGLTCLHGEGVRQEKAHTELKKVHTELM